MRLSRHLHRSVRPRLLGGVIVASSFLLLGDTFRVRLVPWLVSYAVGTLIGVALLALVPEALAALPGAPAMLTMAAGILGFFLLEKAVIWRHCHDDESATCTARPRRS